MGLYKFVTRKSLYTNEQTDLLAMITIVEGQFLVKRAVVTPELQLNVCNYIALQPVVWLSSLHSIDWIDSTWSLFLMSFSPVKIWKDPPQIAT